jgi:hypothetical protein
MTETPAYPGYATPTFTVFGGRWFVGASPWRPNVGWVSYHASGYTADDERGAYVGLFPDKQAAGEALVKHAGYEVL